MTPAPKKKAGSATSAAASSARAVKPAKAPRESQAQRQERAARVLALLYKHYPDAVCALNHRNAFELLIATILSAQCTDARVNMVTPELFKRYPTPERMARATQEEIEALIKTTGFFRNKAKSILGASRLISERFSGSVPQTMDELLQLPGVARKTANVVLGTAFKQNIGVVVDTHVGRLSQRLAFTKETDPVKVERDLMALIPQQSWTDYSHMLIHHGRQICTARKAMCETCPLAAHCPKVGVVPATAPDHV